MRPHQDLARARLPDLLLDQAPVARIRHAAGCAASSHRRFHRRPSRPPLDLRPTASGVRRTSRPSRLAIMRRRARAQPRPDRQAGAGAAHGVTVRSTAAATAFWLNLTHQLPGLRFLSAWVAEGPSWVANVLLYDTTLRDGTQGTGISFSLADKIDIARRLDGFGFDYVEGGWPGSNPKDEEFFDALKTAPLRRARLTAFGSTRHKGARAEQDANLKALVAAGTPAVAIFAKAWDFQVEVVLRTTLDENLEMVRRLGRLSEGSRARGDLRRRAFLRRLPRQSRIRARRRSPRRPRPAPTGWCSATPMAARCRAPSPRPSPASVARFGVPVGIHAHNDGELAVANSLAAVARGRAPGPGHDQRLRRADRQRQSLLGAAEPRAQGRRGMRRRRAPCRADGVVPGDRGDGQGRAQSAARLMSAPPPSPTRAACTSMPWLRTRAPMSMSIRPASATSGRSS